MPAASRAAGMATAGPTPISSGCTPTTWKERSVPSGRSPSSSALRRDMSSTAAAPSLTWLDVPAVTEPPSLNTGLSLARRSTVVPARGPSSAETTVPSSSVTGTISSANLPLACAASAFACDSTPIWSCSSRVMPYRSATFSAVMPMGTRHCAASGLDTTSLRLSGGCSLGLAPPPLLMLSTPAAMPTLIWPAWMAAATFATA
mmetsp:Transcript_3178/g.8233  ORF Transcript_3178/g.8233 Transcript_3178/m.8233 type:complete len:203 (+) Transcript_3178:829-1437(+)